MGEFVPIRYYQNVTSLTRTETSFNKVLKLVCVLINSTADKITPRYDKSDVAETHPCRHKVTPDDGTQYSRLNFQSI
jgi:hypothetical protein